MLPLSSSAVSFLTVTPFGADLCLRSSSFLYSSLSLSSLELVEKIEPTDESLLSEEEAFFLGLSSSSLFEDESESDFYFRAALDALVCTEPCSTCGDYDLCSKSSHRSASDLDFLSGVPSLWQHFDAH